jgi:Domain of unknown function (DUF4198)
MTKRLRLSLVAALLALATPVEAHDGWLEAHPILVERGQPVSLFLMYGNHGNDHRSYRIAGKWRPEYATVVVTGPAGPPVDLTSQVTDLGDAEDVGPKGPKGFHVTTFAPAQDGAYIALVTQSRELQVEGAKFQSIGTAKVLFGALASPVVAAAQRLTGFDRAVGGADALEIIPVTNPLALRTGDVLTVEIRHRGRPLPSLPVSIVRRIQGAPSAQTLTTDDRGQVKIVAGPADYYLTRAALEERTGAAGGQVDKRVFEATYVFVVHRP